MKILNSIIPEEVQDWENRLNMISRRFKRAISFLNEVIERAEKGMLTSIGELQPSKPSKTSRVIEEIEAEEEEDKKLNLVSAMLEVFDSASALEKLINEVEKEANRTVNTAKFVISVIQKKTS